MRSIIKKKTRKLKSKKRKFSFDIELDNVLDKEPPNFSLPKKNPNNLYPLLSYSEPKEPSMPKKYTTKTRHGSMYKRYIKNRDDLRRKATNKEYEKKLDDLRRDILEDYRRRNDERIRRRILAGRIAERLGLEDTGIFNVYGLNQKVKSRTRRNKTRQKRR